MNTDLFTHGELYKQPGLAGNGHASAIGGPARDQPPQPALAAEIRALQARRARALREMRAALGRRTLGDDARVLKRAEAIADLWRAHRRATEHRLHRRTG